MNLSVAASLAGAALVGLLVVGFGWWSAARLWRQPLLLGGLAVGSGLGFSSCLFFIWLALGLPGAAYPPAELGLLMLLASLIGLAGGVHRRLEPVRDAGAVAPVEPRWLLVMLGVTLACSTTAFVLEAAAQPHGGWDAWMTWNMHARAIFRGGEHWGEVLQALPAWSHPDYPLLVPGSVARVWTYGGRETPLGPASVAMLFTLATVVVLYSSVAVLRSRTQGALAALLLLGTKFFVLHGTSQFADIPLGFFFLATLALLALAGQWSDDRHRLVPLAGALAGLSAWTKNEGLLFVLAVLVGHGLVVARGEGWRRALRDARAFAFGLAPVLVLLACFKLWLAPPNDLMSDHGLRATAARVLDGTRYAEVGAGFQRAFLEITAKGLAALVLVAYGALAGLAPAGSARPGAKTAAIVLGLMVVGYAAVLLTVPTPLLGTNVRSINRLLLQLWPSTLLAYFLAVRTAEETGALAPRLSPA